MRDGKAVELTYQSFWREEPHSFVLHPYCLKLFKQRWYMLGKSEEYDNPRIYALDERMKNVIPLNRNLKVPSRFNAEEFFSNYFGVIVDGRKPSMVKIKVAADQVRYFESLPVHKSQRVIESTPEYSVFQYQIVPTFDFRQEILSHGPAVEVLAPEELRDEIAADVTQMHKIYGL